MSKQNYDKRYHNTKLLLKNYKDFKEHCEGCSETLADIDATVEPWEFIRDVNEKKYEDYIVSARRTKARTKTIIDLIDKFLKAYRDDAVMRNDNNKLLRSDIIDLIYISDNLTFEQLAEKFDIDRSTVSRYHGKAINELSVLFFGVEGLKLDA